MSRTLCAATIALLLTTMRISAHHAFDAEYDVKRRISVSGTVTNLKWINPHAWLYVDGRDERGKITKWSFEMGSTGGLTARGWKKTDLKAGDRVTVEGFRAKSGKNVYVPGRWSDVKTSNVPFLSGVSTTGLLPFK